MKQFKEGQFSSLYYLKKSNGKFTIKLGTDENKNEYAIKTFDLSSNPTVKEQQIKKAKEEFFFFFLDYFI